MLLFEGETGQANAEPVSGHVDAYGIIPIIRQNAGARITWTSNLVQTSSMSCPLAWSVESNTVWMPISARTPIWDCVPWLGTQARVSSSSQEGHVGNWIDDESPLDGERDRRISVLLLEEAE